MTDACALTKRATDFQSNFWPSDIRSMPTKIQAFDWDTVTLVDPFVNRLALARGATTTHERYFNTNPFETLPTPRLSLTCPFHHRKICHE